jgi:hypothetical protein
LVTVRLAIDIKLSPRLYIRYAATKPDTTVARKMNLLIVL